MEEVAKAIKVNALLIIASCATVAAFLISPASSVHHYKAAKDELDGLQQVIRLSKEYRKHVANILNDQGFKLLEDAMDVRNPMSLIVKNAPDYEKQNAVCAGCAAAPSPAAVNAPVGAVPAPPSTNEVVPPPSSSIATNAPTSAYTKPAPQLIETFELSKQTWKSVEKPVYEEGVQVAKIPKKCCQNWGDALPFTCDSPSNSMTIADLLLFLSKEQAAIDYRQEVQIFMPHSIDFAEKFRLLLACEPNGTLSNWQLTGVGYPATPQPGSSCVSMARLICNFDEEKEDNGKKVTVTSTRCVSVKGDWRCGACIAAPIQPFMQWAVDADRSSLLVVNGIPKKDQSKDDGAIPNTWLPTCHKIWSDINKIKIEEAISVVEARIEKETERISLFGLSASAASASLAFPLAVIFAFLVNMVQIHHLQKNIRLNTEEGIAVQSQWFGFFPTWGAWLLTNSLLHLFPIVVFVLLWGASHPYPWQRAINWSLLVALTVAGIVHACLLTSLRRVLSADVDNVKKQAVAGA